MEKAAPPRFGTRAQVEANEVALLYHRAEEPQKPVHIFSSPLQRNALLLISSSQREEINLYLPDLSPSATSSATVPVYPPRLTCVDATPALFLAFQKGQPIRDTADLSRFILLRGWK